MNRIFEYTISPTDAPCTVGEFLKQKGYSRQIIIHLKKTENGILRNGVWAYVRTQLFPGDSLKITLVEENASENILPVPIEPEIVYEDEDLVVVNKPFDMPVHPSIHNYDNTLANAMAYYYQQQGETFIFRCINRLDRASDSGKKCAERIHSLYSYEKAPDSQNLPGCGIPDSCSPCRNH